MDKVRLLVKVQGDGKALKAKMGAAFAVGDADLTPILSLPASTRAGFAAAGSAGAGATWMRVGLDRRDENAWDMAHRLLAPDGNSLAGEVGVQLVEPDLDQSWQAYPPGGGPDAMGLDAGNRCEYIDQDKGSGKACGPQFAWNLLDAYSQLKTARGKVSEAQLRKILIAHLDTGYDPGHASKPLNLNTELQRNFVDKEWPNDARDRVPEGMTAIRNRGHGTGTLSLLAGNKVPGQPLPDGKPFDDFLGAAPYCGVLPVRIADWVVRFSTGTMVQGFAHATQSGAHVISMSMGGLTSAALCDAVNLAYERGIVMVTAAGNNFSGIPSPKTIVFPARFRRVLAACGVMADGRAYTDLAWRTMQGNHGPDEKMETALGAYTPNVPWATLDCGNGVTMDGAGTSAATPQIAGAAALWLALNWETVKKYSQPWMRVEAVRQALFASALGKTAKMNARETFETIGKGVMQAAEALKLAPAKEASLTKQTKADVATWGWLDLLLGVGGVTLAPADGEPRRAGMYKLELTQMSQRVASVDAAAARIEAAMAAGKGKGVDAALGRQYLEAALDEGQPSRPLRRVLEAQLGRVQVAAAGAPVLASSPAPVRRKRRALPDPSRRLRVYALDPSIAKSLDSVAVNETVISIPWEENLKPGPVGEYLEVVDIDPASGKLYDPVDLNNPKLLAQDGWNPSEGNPQFHQQMVYAVAMQTIGNFEAALGRRVIWAPRWAKVTENGETRQVPYGVPRLRLYPHALRTNNAYYSPAKKALLFGYFQAMANPDVSTAPGSMVFACLSSDIVSHEMSHALLDGLHRRFQEASNPDVPAFHEAFADIVALFQHFAIPELVSFEIARSHGQLGAANLLGGLAKQFGEGTQRGGPLRDYLSSEIHKLDYCDPQLETHARGSILVSAIFDAFIRIVDRRTADLVRLATNGSGLLPAGALHPDLVARLTEETCKVARHVLRMCIRALDYCPAVDITFGEYLRALVTADSDLVKNDRYYYRVAFMEAFKKRNLLPADVRTVSEETLAWNTLEDPRPDWLDPVLEKLDMSWDRSLPRSRIFEVGESNRWAMWNVLKEEFIRNPALPAHFGLLPDLPAFKEDGTVRKPPPPGGTTFDVLSVRPARRVAPDGSFRTEAIATVMQRMPVLIDPGDPQAGWFWFRGGATLILDAREGNHAVRYSIVKRMNSASRQERQRRMVSGQLDSPLRALYFGGNVGGDAGKGMGAEPFAMLHAHTGGFGHG